MTNPISKFFRERRARAISLRELEAFLDANQNAASKLSEFRAEMEREVGDLKR